MAAPHDTSPNTRFLRAGAVEACEPAADRLGRAAGGSLLAHSVLAIVILGLLGGRPRLETPTPVSVTPPDSIVWIVQSGPGGGGGGGGDQASEPPRTANARGSDGLTMPVAAREALEPEPKPASQSARELVVPVLSAAADLIDLPGVISPLPVATTSLGAGTGAGAGGGRGGGAGDGQGDGLGAGQDHGMGGDAYQPGNGVSFPRLVFDPAPRYTGEAMQARVQGVVWLEAVVLPDGSVGAVQITRSLDTQYGLDREAVRTVRAWRFLPGARDGKPVAVRVPIEMTFTLR